MIKTKIIQRIFGGALAIGLLASSFAILADPSTSQDQPTPPVPHAQPGLPAHRHGGALLVKNVANRINLSPDQRIQMKQILDANKSTVQDIRQKMDQNQAKIHQLTLSDEKGKEGKIEQLAKAQGKLMTKMIVDNAKIADQMKAVLTPEQVEQLRHLGGPLGHPLPHDQRPLVK